MRSTTMSTNHENRSELTKKVKELLSKVLDIEEDEMQLDTLLFKELAIESAETLEITFRLEQEFSISIGEAEFWNIANLIANEDMIVDGNFTEEAKTLIKENISITDSEIEELHSPFEIYDYISVKDLVDYLEKKLN